MRFAERDTFTGTLAPSATDGVNIIIQGKMGGCEIHPKSTKLHFVISTGLLSGTLLSNGSICSQVHFIP